LSRGRARLRKNEQVKSTNFFAPLRETRILFPAKAQSRKDLKKSIKSGFNPRPSAAQVISLFRHRSRRAFREAADFSFQTGGTRVNL
jgi:hypothetical protein